MNSSSNRYPGNWNRLVEPSDSSPENFLRTLRIELRPDGGTVYTNDSSLQKPMAKRASKSIGPLDGEFDAALQAFSAEAGIYCEGISDHTAHQYAASFMILLENRAREIDTEEPRSPGLFEPNRKLIRSTLNSLYGRHFRTPGRGNVRQHTHAVPASG